MTEVKDPVCGMMIDRDTAAAQVTHGSEEYSSVPTSAGVPFRPTRTGTPPSSTSRRTR